MVYNTAIMENTRPLGGFVLITRLLAFLFMFSWVNNFILLSRFWSWREWFAFNYCPFTFASFSTSWSNNFSLPRSWDFFARFIELILTHRITTGDYCQQPLCNYIKLGAIYHNYEHFKNWWSLYKN